MPHSSCIFCKIINQQLPATVIWQDDEVMVIKDIAPRAPIHYLVIPKIHIENINELVAQDSHLAHKLLATASRVMRGKDFRLLANEGAGAGQKVFHMHFHILAGSQMSDF